VPEKRSGASLHSNTCQPSQSRRTAPVNSDTGGALDGNIKSLTITSQSRSADPVNSDSGGLGNSKSASSGN
jgi:hypothetical protein